MNGVLRRLVSVALDRPRLAIGVFVAATAVAATLLPRLRLETDGRGLLPPGHAAIVQQERIDTMYGSADLVMIGIDARRPGGAFTVAALERLHRLTRRIESEPFVDVDGVWSLATIVLPRTTNETLSVTALLSAPPRDDMEATAIGRRAVGEPLFRGRLVSDDGSAVAIYVRIARDANRDAAVASLEQLVRAEQSLTDEVRFHVLGPAVAEAGLGRHILRDLAVLLPLALAVVALLLWVLFRSGVIVLAGLAEGAATICFTFALMAVLDQPITLVSVVMPVILGTYCVADTVHIAHRFVGKLRNGPSRRQAMEETLDEIVRPVVFTSLTTAGGFLSFVLTPIPPLRDFGIFTAAGTIVALAISLFVVPPMLVAGSIGSRSVRVLDGPMGGGLLRITEVARRKPFAVIAAFSIVTIAIAAGTLRLEIQDRWVDNFDRDSRLARAEAWFNETFFGSNVLNVIIRGSATDPAVLASVDAMARDLEGHPDVGGTAAWTAQLRAVGRAIAGEDRLPREPFEAEQWALLLESAGGRSAVEPYVDPLREHTNLWLFVNRADYQRTKAVERAAADAAARRGLVIEAIGGDARIGSALVSAIATGQRASIAGSLLLVLALTAVMLRSPARALLATLPVTVGVLAIAGLMGWSGIAVGVATSTFTSIAIGVGVDLAIHWLESARIAGAETGDFAELLRRAARSSGRGIAANAIVVAAGFGVLLISSVPPVRNLGLLMAVTIAACSIATVFLLPAVLSSLHAVSAGRAAVRRIAIVSLLMITAASALHGGEPSGLDIMRLVNGRDSGASARMTLRLVLTDVRRGSHERQIELVRGRTTAGYRSRFTVTAPEHLEGIALFLLEDQPTSRLWMYFPAGDHLTQVVTRGLSALASDFSCEDLKVAFPLDDYHFASLGREIVDGHSCWRVEMTPRTETLQRELGFTRAIGWIHAAASMVVRAEFYDEAGRVFKSFRADPPERIDGIWTLRRYSMINDRARHRSDVIVTSVEYGADVPTESFDPRRLKKEAARP